MDQEESTYFMKSLSQGSDRGESDREVVIREEGQRRERKLEIGGSRGMCGNVGRGMEDDG